MVGDAGPDVGVARRAGVPVIGVEFGYTDVPIAELKPDRLIDHMRDLPEAVESLMPPNKDIDNVLILLYNNSINHFLTMSCPRGCARYPDAPMVERGLWRSAAVE